MCCVCRSEVPWPADMNSQLRDMLNGLLQKDPAVRLSWPHLLYQPFIADGEHFILSLIHLSSMAVS